jgi:hypothetical protein
MTKKSVALAVLATLGLGASLATAGAQDQFGFYISAAGQGYRYANGAFAEVRSLPDATAFAECGTNASMGFCSFVQNGEYSSCYTTNPATLDAIRGMAGDGYFSVQWSESTAECTYVLQYTSSRTPTKAH